MKSQNRLFQIKAYPVNLYQNLREITRNYTKIFGTNFPGIYVKIVKFSNRCVYQFLLETSVAGYLTNTVLYEISHLQQSLLLL